LGTSTVAVLNDESNQRMKDITPFTDALCRMVETLQANPLGALILVLLATCAVAAGWAWRR
jgi:hypothetical protein